MPILDARHDLAHPVEGDSAWSESYYFNAYDPGTDSGLVLPHRRPPQRGDDGRRHVVVAPRRRARHLPLGQGAARDGRHAPGGRCRPLRDARSRAVVAPDRWTAKCRRARASRGATATHEVPVALDVRFDAITPAIGTDGQPSGGPKSAEAAAAAGTVGKGHLEQAGRWTGSLTSTACATSGSARTATVTARGARGAGAARRCGAGSPSTSGEDMHFGGIRLGTDAGDLHRGWVWDGRRAVVRRRVARAHRAGRRRGNAPGRAPRRRGQGGTHLPAAGRRDAGGRHRACGRHHGQRGAGPLDLHRPRRRAHTGYGICEYLHQLDDSGRPVVPVY